MKNIKKYKIFENRDEFITRINLTQSENKLNESRKEFSEKIDRYKDLVKKEFKDEVDDCLYDIIDDYSHESAFWGIGVSIEYRIKFKLDELDDFISKLKSSVSNLYNMGFSVKMNFKFYFSRSSGGFEYSKRTMMREEDTLEYWLKYIDEMHHNIHVNPKGANGNNWRSDPEFFLLELKIF